MAVTRNPTTTWTISNVVCGNVELLVLTASVTLGLSTDTVAGLPVVPDCLNGAKPFMLFCNTTRAQFNGTNATDVSFYAGWNRSNFAVSEAGVVSNGAVVLSGAASIPSGASPAIQVVKYNPILTAAHPVIPVLGIVLTGSGTMVTTGDKVFVIVQ